MDWERQPEKMEVEELYTDKYHYTDEQKDKNYQRILKTIRYLENNGQITEDWIVKHSGLIRMYRAWIPDFNILNTDSNDAGFRQLARETEQLITTLINTMDIYKYINTVIYLQFVKNIKKMYENILADDELDECMGRMSM
jgi:hypothetical protein